MGKDNLRLGFCFAPAHWRATNAHIILIVVALIFLAATAARAADQVMTAYQSVTIGSSTPLWIAKDAGFFERQGLDVKIVFVEGSPRTMQTLIAGEAQIVESTGPAVLNARAAGSSVVIVAGYVNVMPYYLIVDNSINSPAELKGKVGANHMPGTAADTVIRIGLKALGLDPDRDVSLRPIGNTPSGCRRCRRASRSLWSLRIWSFSKRSDSVTRFSWITWPTKPPSRWAAL